MIRTPCGQNLHWFTPHFEKAFQELNSVKPIPKTTAAPCTSSPTIVNSSSHACGESSLSLQDPTPPESNSITVQSSFNFPSPQPSTSFSSSLSCTQSDPEISPVSQINKRKRTSAQSTPSVTEKTLKKKRTATANKSTQTEAFDADVVEQCNVCLGTEEKGQWVGCSHRGKKCDYWVHDSCLGFNFKTKKMVKQVSFLCPKHMK